MLELEDFSMFQNENTLYIQYDNGEQINVNGEHVRLITMLITLLEEKKQIDQKEILEFFTKQDSDIKNLIPELLEWMISSNLIKRVNEKVLSRKISVFGNFHDKKNIQKFVESLSTENINYSYKETNFSPEEVKDLDIVLVIGSGFENFKEILHLNQLLFLKNKTLIYAEISQQHITIGPICYKPLETPCLESFFKRRISNDYDNFKRISGFLEAPIRKSFKFFDKSKFTGLLSEFLKLEIEDLVTKNYSSLMGNSLVYNNVTKELYKTKIIKVHNLSYEKSSYVNPFS